MAWLAEQSMQAAQWGLAIGALAEEAKQYGRYFGGDCNALDPDKIIDQGANGAIIGGLTGPILAGLFNAVAPFARPFVSPIVSALKGAWTEMADMLGVRAAEDTARTFYTVQNEANASRLLSGGAPWPTSATKAHLGEGLYTWGTRAQAEAHLAALEGRGASGLRIMQASIPESQYQALRSIDLRDLSDEAAGAWLGEHSSLFGQGLPHGLDHVIRNTGNFGPEFFFSKDAFQLFELR